jgi:hypothetical protein
MLGVLSLDLRAYILRIHEVERSQEWFTEPCTSRWADLLGDRHILS